ncbi:MAG: PKD domain-containing protein [Thermoplasmata archaeon]|nr:PKD domain-containing protein [Thermoplasmata archaeon]
MSEPIDFQRATLRRDPRAMTPITSIVVVVVVLALVGLSAYGIAGGFSPAAVQTCQPATSIACGAASNAHDIVLIAPFHSVQQGGAVPLTVSLPAGESTSSYTYNFGDGTSTTTASPTVSHIYNTTGTYLISVKAMVDGLPHDNYLNLVEMQVTQSFANDVNGTLPTVQASIVHNATNVSGGPSPTAALLAGQSITLQGTYATPPSAASFVDVKPTFKFPSSVTETPVGTSTNSSIEGAFLFPTAGIFNVTFVGGATNNTNNLTVPNQYANYTWTVIVPPADTGIGVAGQVVHKSPHPGEIINYEIAPGGARSEDPAIAYDTVSAEPVANVYQTLIQYNGSQTGPTYASYVPVLATCVPGSPQCQNMYGSDLINNVNNYTFVISSAPQFYDHATGNSWGVYPTDVLFSMARDLGFSTLPSPTINPGWIVAQALLGPGNATWDTIHQSYNNSPLDILDSMTVNGSFCPAIAMSQAHGCITFNADAKGLQWPYFLELISDDLGAGIVPCGWFSAQAQNAGIPYWTAGNSTGNGDHPCQVPGATANGITWGRAANQIPAEGWDQWETIGSGATGRFGGNVQYNMAGSGPYYLSQYSVGLSFTLTASPVYSSNPLCTWAGCMPKPGTFAKTVSVTWDPTAQEGEQALGAGIADFAGVPSTDFAFLLELISQGKVVASTSPTLSVFFDAFDLQFSLSGAQQFSTVPITVKSDFFSYLGVREFFTHAYPYNTIEKELNTYDGIVLGTNYGGAIPQYMANYYPTNISWPSGDPCTSTTDPACAAYWWFQLHNDTNGVPGPYYDPELASCSSANPCTLPLVGQTGNPTGDEENALWVDQLTSLSGGALKVIPTDINFLSSIINSQDSAPTQNPMPIFGIGWAPDYPDPTDYTTPLYLENSTYTYGDADAQSLYTSAYGAKSCPVATDYSYYANNMFAQDCQGVAYKSMVKLLGMAGVTPACTTGTALTCQRNILYTMGEKIANQLALYVYTDQQAGFSYAASWINIYATPPNVVTAGPQYAFVQGNGVIG